jgi:hypothetical protein
VKPGGCSDTSRAVETIHFGQLATGTPGATPVSPTTATYSPATALEDLAHNAVTTPLVSANQRF